ncbi:DsbA family protein [Pseudonocardia nematodicida]|uniref:DsbA family protein n=1 Tax=Pseudonocardia nematodicida TaxID=1206997 RepID=A0ABV1KBF7_9PSEU
MSDELEFFFDPICPFAWVTSRWVVEVGRQHELAVSWRPLPLAMLNEGISYAERMKVSESYPDSHRRGLEMLRVIRAAQDKHGPEVVGDLYTGFGELVWDSPAPDGDGFDPVMRVMAQRRDLRPVLEGLGLSPALADAADDDSHDAELRAAVADVRARCGDDVGTPVLSFSPPDGPALFGPVIDSVPFGEDAIRLWDAVYTLASWPGFAELKRSIRSFPDTPLTARIAGGETTVR